MKIYSCLLLAFLLVASSLSAQSFYEQTIKDAQGNPVNLNCYKGKKLLIVMLSGQQSDTSLVRQLVSFQNRYGGGVSIIGVPSMEDGYFPANDQQLKNMIRQGNLTMLLTEGVHVKKASGEAQALLMKWLTDKNGNRHFNQEAMGSGQKFFLDEVGTLYAIMKPEVSLEAPVIDRIVGKPAVNSGEGK